MDVVPYPPQTIHCTFAADLLPGQLEQFDGPVEGDPRHHFGMGEVLRRPTYLPYALVREMPNPR